MIDKLTPEQEVLFPEFMDRWFKRATGPIKKDASVIKQLYTKVGEKEPVILYFTSPMLCHLAAAFLSNQLRNQLWNQLENQLETQLENQLENQLRNQLGTQLWNQLENQLRNQLRNQYFSYWFYWWGCYFNFVKYIGVDFSQDFYKEFMQYVSLNMTFFIPYSNIIFISENPLCSWKGNQLHSETDMAVKYEDGWGWYCLNGVPMKPEYILTAKENMTPNMVMECQDIDQRRELIRKFGADRLVDFGKVIEISGNKVYKLVDMSPIFAGLNYAPHLLMKNPSLDDTWHLEGVGRECQTIEQALNWRKPEAMKKIPVSDKGEDWYQQGDVCIWRQQAVMLKPFPAQLT